MVIKKKPVRSDSVPVKMYIITNTITYKKENRPMGGGKSLKRKGDRQIVVFATSKAKAIQKAKPLIKQQHGHMVLTAHQITKK